MTQINKHFFPALCMLMFFGCSDFSSYKIEVVLPKLPEHITGATVNFSVVYPNAPDSFTSKKYMHDSSFFIDSQLAVLPVLAYADVEPTAGSLPRVSASAYPAGGVFPADSKNSKLILSWENGFAAEILYKAVTNNINLDNFNITRFEKTLIEKSDGNPWIFEEDDIIYSLSFGIFSSTFLKKKAMHNITLQFPFYIADNVKYFCLNFLEKREFETKDNMLVITGIAERNISFMQINPLDNADANVIELFLDSSGWSSYFSNGTQVLSGRYGASRRVDN